VHAVAAKSMAPREIQSLFEVAFNMGDLHPTRIGIVAVRSVDFA
jgi:hypothetical protein